MKNITFEQVENGQEFESVSGSFIKINSFCAKRTEDHWKTSPKVWHFSPTQAVSVEG